MLNIESSRTKTIAKQIGLNIVYKGGSVLLTLFFVPLSIKYLGTNDYGVWLTLFSFVAFFNFFDFGLGHGLRNHLTKALSLKNHSLAKEYISTAYVSISLISLGVIVLFLFLFDLIDWQLIFKVPVSNLKSFLILVKIVFLGFFLNFCLKLINIVYYSLLKPSIPGFFAFLNTFFSFIIIYILLILNKESLLIYGSVIMGVQLLVFIIANMIFFRNKFKYIRPSIFYFKLNLAKDIFGLGGKFLLLQVAALILYSTDNMIITQLFSPNEVTVYNVAYKYFGVFTMLATLVLGPLWSAITDAEASNDISWIKNIISKSLKLILVLSFATIVLYLISDFIYGIWVGKDIVIPRTLSLFMAFYVISSMYLQVYAMYLNGVGKIKIQVLVGSFVAIMNIPLSIIFAKYLEMGIAGVIFATLVCNIISLAFLPLQYSKIINGSAKGIWNK